MPSTNKWDSDSFRWQNQDQDSLKMPPLDKWASYDESMIFYALDLSELDLGVPDLVKEQILDEMLGTFFVSPLLLDNKPKRVSIVAIE